MTNLERRSNSYYEAVIIELQLTTSAQTATIMDHEKRLCDATRLANRVILIGEKEGWFEWKGDVETGGNHSSLHRDLTKVANQRVYKDFCDAHIMMIKTLEARIASDMELYINLKKLIEFAKLNKEGRMTKEESNTYTIVREVTTFGSCEQHKLLHYFNKFFSQNVVIPKGKNRHTQANELHQWIEGVNLEVLNEDFLSLNEWECFPPAIKYLNSTFRTKESIYEWQWILYSDATKTYCRGATTGYYTDEEECNENVVPSYYKEKLENTKRERKEC